MCQRITMRNAWTYLSAEMVLYCTNNYICYDIKRKGDNSVGNEQFMTEGNLVGQAPGVYNVW